MEHQQSEAIYRRALEVLPGGISRNTIFRKPFPNYVEAARGCKITDVEGVTRIDFANNMASLIHGHSFQPVVEAVTEQITKGTAYTMASAIEVAYAELLCHRVPGFDKIRFMNSGTEAVMAMIKAARAFTGRPKIAKAEGAYHGTYDYAEVSQTAAPANWGSIDHPNSTPVVQGTPQGVLNDVVVFPFNDIERTLAILDRQAGEIACVLVDPVPHRVGLLQAHSEFIEALYHWTRKNGALLVFDEVVTFRVHYTGAQEKYPIRPDLTALGKIIGGGFPVGALAGHADVMQMLDPRESPLRFPHSGTFSANPVTMTAGFVAMSHFDQEAVLKINAITQKAKDQIAEAAALAGVPLSITGAGSMFRMHFRSTPPQTYREAYQPKERAAVMNAFIDHLYYQGKILTTNTCSCMFSTAITQTEVDQLTEAMLNGFRALKGEILAAANE
ncbi:MAG TPA: aspartate aminotransferase family protein [Bacteroidales bacterium]|nr:aspartate aminotransferase family protein [Bacteroidales bacterium]